MPTQTDIRTDPGLPTGVTQSMIDDPADVRPDYPVEIGDREWNEAADEFWEREGRDLLASLHDQSDEQIGGYIRVAWKKYLAEFAETVKR